LDKLSKEYLEKTSEHCFNKVWDEGIVFSKRVGGFTGLKLKSSNFVLGETVQIDAGEENIDDL